MCRICDGYSFDDVSREIDLGIRVHGFYKLHVEGPRGWTYTLGLKEGFDHPDLVSIAIEPEVQRRHIDLIAHAVVRDGRASPDLLEMADLELVSVDPAHLRGDLVAAWVRRQGRSPGIGDIVQVLPGPSHSCECHGRSIPRLDDPTVLSPGWTNRAMRRARRRRGRAS